MAELVNFSDSKQFLVLKPKTVAKAAFHYRNNADLENLIDFVGSKPKVDIGDKGELILMYRKRIIKDNTIILSDAFGNVSDILDYKSASEIYEVVAQSDTKPTATKAETKAAPKK